MNIYIFPSRVSYSLYLSSFMPTILKSKAVLTREDGVWCAEIANEAYVIVILASAIVSQFSKCVCKTIKLMLAVV